MEPEPPHAPHVDTNGRAALDTRPLSAASPEPLLPASFTSTIDAAFVPLPSSRTGERQVLNVGTKSST